MAKNMTTIEYCERRGGQGPGARSIYDVGLLGNIESVMGENWYLWTLPLGRPPGDGVFWKTGTDNCAAISSERDIKSDDEQSPEGERDPTARLVAGLRVEASDMKFVRQLTQPGQIFGAWSGVVELTNDIAAEGRQILKFAAPRLFKVLFQGPAASHRTSRAAKRGSWYGAWNPTGEGTIPPATEEAAALAEHVAKKAWGQHSAQDRPHAERISTTIEVVRSGGAIGSSDSH